jgi:uncharacterized protein (TIGR00269 family)
MDRLFCECGEKAVYLDNNSGISYCKKCFLNYIYKKAVKTIKHYNMIEIGDKILLAVSGGKDSIVLVDIMGKLAKKLQKIKLFAVTIDEGIEIEGGNYRNEAIEYARVITQKYSIPHKVVSYRELFGGSLTEYVKANVYKGSACSVCGVFRRRAINLIAEELGANKIATGHNKDDEAQTILMNVLRGDLERILRLNNISEEFIPRIKPLRRISEREIAMYAYLKGYKFQINECPYSHDAIRDKVRDVLEQVSTQINGVYDALLNFQDKLVNYITIHQVTLNKCIYCGKPTSPKSKICKPCEYKLEFTKKINYIHSNESL